MADFSVGFKVSGINSLVKQLEKYANVGDTIDNHLEEIGERYTKVAQDNLKRAIHTQKYGDLLADEIHYRKDKHGVTIIAGMFPDYIKQLYFAEFGAGMVSSQHPLAQEYGWTYDINNHGEEGWAYYTTTNDKGIQNGISTPIFKNDGRIVALVKSSEPALFMYNTYRTILGDGFIAKLIKDSLENFGSYYDKKG